MDYTFSPYNLQQLTVAKYLFHIRVKTRIELPPYKGSALHGGFGHALKKIAPSYHRILCEPGKNRDDPKPFVLLPPLDTDKSYQPGHEFSFELTLFGNAIAHFSICHAALEYLGRNMGFGNTRGKFTIEDIETAQPATTSRHDIQLPGISGLEIAASRTLSGNRITIHLPTRLRLKADGRLIRNSPPFKLFFARLIGRLNTLSTYYGGGKIAEHDLRDHLLELAEDIKIIQDNATWKDLPRFSGRQQQWMKFGGLLGAITYEGDFEPFLPALAIGEWTHAGGKTSFGLGKYVIDNNDPFPHNKGRP